MWEDSKLHNAQLQKELGEVRRDLESVRCQLETMAIRVNININHEILHIHNIMLQAVNQKSVSDAEKREKLIVIKKLEGLEKELKVTRIKTLKQLFYILKHDFIHISSLHTLRV